MTEKRLTFAISSASTVPVDGRILTKQAADITMERAAVIMSQAGKQVPTAAIRLSFHPSQAVHGEAARLAISKHNLDVGSIDVPDVVSIPHQLRAQVRDLFTGEISLGRIKEHIGWFILNFPNPTAVLDAMVTSTNFYQDAHRTWIRMNAAHFKNQPTLTNQLITDAGLQPIAVEIDPDSQTVSDYLTFMDQLQNEKKGKALFGLDIDTAHVLEAERQSSTSVGEVVTRLFSNPWANHIGLLSVSGPGGHRSIRNGWHDIQPFIAAYATATVKGTQHYPATILPEFSPADYDSLVDDETLWSEIAYAFFK